MKFKRSKNKQSNPNTSQAVIGGPKPSKIQPDDTKASAKTTKHGKKPIFLIVLVLVVFGLAGAGIFWQMQQDSNSPPESQDNNQDNSLINDFYNPPKQDTTIRQMDYTELRRTVNKMELAGQIDEAEAIIRGQDSFKDSAQTRQLLVTLIINNKKPDEALEMLLQAERDSELDSSNLSLIADIYKQKGDKQKATQYYRKHISALKASDNPYAGQEIRDIEDAIKDLN